MPHVDLSQDPAEVRRIFLSLGLAGRDEPVIAQPLQGGVSSGIYRVTLRSGDWCLKQALPQLKVAKVWKVPVERVFHEVAWLREVQPVVPGHVPRVVGEDTASKSFVMEFLGEGHRNWKACLLAGEIDLAVAAQVGDVLGRIHSATSGRPEVAARFATDANFHAIRLEPYLEETARVHPALAERLLATVARTAATRRVLVHGDVSPKNILLGPRGPVLLDAECAWYGDPAFDAAFCLNHFLLKAAHRPAYGVPLLEGARRFWASYSRHAQWETAHELEARVAQLLPGLALARIDGKSPVEYLGEETRERVRERSATLVAAAPLELETILQRWKETFIP